MSPASRDLLLILICTVGPWSGASAQSIHKCLIDGSLQYQNARCEGAQVSLPHSVPVSTPTAVDRRPASIPVASNRAATVPATRAIEAVTPPADIVRQWSGELVLGLSDTAILNRSGWGRPQNITRGRSPEGYREEWTYVARRDGSTRTLQFVNGRLAGMNLDAGVAVAAQPPAAPTTTASASAKPPGAVQRPAVAVTAPAAVTALVQQVAVVDTPADSGADRAREAAKVLENAGLVREQGRPTGTVAVPSATATVPPQDETKRAPPGIVTSASESTGSSQEVVVMLGTPAPVTVARTE